MGDEPPAPRGPYDRPRVVVAGALTVVLALLLLWDAVSVEYRVSEVMMTALLTTIAILLGIEAIDLTRGRRP